MSHTVYGKDLLISAVQGAGGTRRGAEEAVDRLLGAITATLAEGSAVRLSGVGTLTPVQRAGREGTAPNGERWRTGASKGVRFKAARRLRDRINPC